MTKQTGKRWAVLVLCVLFTGIFAHFTAFAEDDNSLQSLGIRSEGAVLEQEVAYGTHEYDVTVPKGTKKLELEPVTTNPGARVSSIEGEDLDEDGGTVYVEVTAANGSAFTYVVNVTVDESVSVETETATETEMAAVAAPVPEPQTELQTDNTLYVEVPRDTVTQAQNTITGLQEEIVTYRETISLYTKVIYALIGVAVVLLFLVINLILRNRDRKAELKEYKSLGYTTQSQAVRMQKSAEKKEKKKQKKEAKAAAKAAAKTVNQPEGIDSPPPGVPFSEGSWQDQNGAFDPWGARKGSGNVPSAGSQPPDNARNALNDIPVEPWHSRTAPASQSARGSYYEKAPIDFTPQTSSKSRVMPGYGQGQTVQPFTQPAGPDLAQNAGTGDAGAQPRESVQGAESDNTAPVSSSQEQNPTEAPAGAAGNNVLPTSPKQQDGDVEVDLIDL